MANGTMSSGRITNDAAEYELLSLFTYAALGRDGAHAEDILLILSKPHIRTKMLRSYR